MKLFSWAAVVFLPPTLVAGIFGMNFHYMPELDWRWGYPASLVVMLRERDPAHSISSGAAGSERHAVCRPERRLLRAAAPPSTGATPPARDSKGQR